MSEYFPPEPVHPAAYPRAYLTLHPTTAVPEGVPCWSLSLTVDYTTIQLARDFDPEVAMRRVRTQSHVLGQLAGQPNGLPIDYRPARLAGQPTDTRLYPPVAVDWTAIARAGYVAYESRRKAGYPNQAAYEDLPPVAQDAWMATAQAMAIALAAPPKGRQERDG